MFLLKMFKNLNYGNFEGNLVILEESFDAGQLLIFFIFFLRSY